VVGPIPWVWLRRHLAKEWGCFPWQVDEAIDDGRWDEAALALKLLSIENEYKRG
jgi:hypothetical protein